MRTNFLGVPLDILSMAEVQTIYSQAFRDQLNGSSATSLFTLPPASSNIDITLTRLICDTYLRENGITQGDRLSMASSAREN